MSEKMAAQSATGASYIAGAKLTEELTFADECDAKKHKTTAEVVSTKE